MRVPALLLLAVCSACRASEASLDARSVRVSSASCGGTGEVELALAPRSAIPLPRSAVPAGLALLPDGSLVMAERGSSGVSVRSPERTETRWIPAPEPLPVLVRAGTELLGAGLTAVYRIDTDKNRVEPLMEVPVRTGRIVSLASDGRTVWAGTGDVPAGTGMVYAASRQAPRQWRRVHMEAPVRLEATGDGRAGAALTRAPHRVVLFDSLLATSAGAEPSTGRHSRGDGRFTQALIALDCGRLLHVVSDLRSDRRELNLFQVTAQPRLLRARSVEQPLGFVHALEGRSVGAVIEKAGRREIVLFEWSWNSEREES